MASSRSTAADDIAHGDSLPPPTSETYTNNSLSTNITTQQPPRHSYPAIRQFTLHHPSLTSLNPYFSAGCSIPFTCLSTRILGTPYCSRAPCLIQTFARATMLTNFSTSSTAALSDLDKNTLHLMRARRFAPIHSRTSGIPRTIPHGSHSLLPTTYILPTSSQLLPSCHSSTIPGTIPSTLSPSPSFSFLDGSSPRQKYTPIYTC